MDQRAASPIADRPYGLYVLGAVAALLLFGFLWVFNFTSFF